MATTAKKHHGMKANNALKHDWNVWRFLNRHFYRYESPRPLEKVEADLKELESDIVRILGEFAN